MRTAGHDEVIPGLRARIALREHGRAKPGGGLGRGTLHDIVGGGRDLPHTTAAAL